jgi:hypothetical protein
MLCPVVSFNPVADTEFLNVTICTRNWKKLLVILVTGYFQLIHLHVVLLRHAKIKCKAEHSLFSHERLKRPF